MSDVAHYTLSDLVDRTVALLRVNAGPTAAVVAALTAGYTALEGGLVAGGWAEALTFALAAASLAGQYVLIRTALAAAGLPISGRSGFGAFVGLSIFSWLLIGIGFLLLVVPGVILLVRWWAALPVLLSSEVGILESLDESWRQTKGRFWPVAGIVVVTLAPVFAIAFVPVAADPTRALVEIGAINLFISALQAAGWLSSVALFSFAAVPHGQLAEVFE